MSEIVPWVTRAFNFDFPVSLYPNILARVRGTPPRLEDAVRGLTREQLVAKRSGKWSIQENAGHLLDEEKLFWRRLEEYRVGAESLTPAPYQNIELTHREIAEHLRVYRESVTAALGELRKAGIIAVDRKRIRILNRLRLERATRE